MVLYGVSLLYYWNRTYRYYDIYDRYRWYTIPPLVNFFSGKPGPQQEKRASVLVQFWNRVYSHVALISSIFFYFLLFYFILRPTSVPISGWDIEFFFSILRLGRKNLNPCLPWHVDSIGSRTDLCQPVTNHGGMSPWWLPHLLVDEEKQLQRPSTTNATNKTYNNISNNNNNVSSSCARVYLSLSSGTRPSPLWRPTFSTPQPSLRRCSPWSESELY